MKKYGIFLLIIMTAFLAVSCGQSKTGNGGFLKDKDLIADETGNGGFFKDKNFIADETAQKIVSTIKNDSVDEFETIFTNNVRIGSDFKENAKQFIDFVEGDVLSFTKPSTDGVGAEGYKNNGEAWKQIFFHFDIQTTTNLYHVAVKQYTTNSFNINDIGVMSLYIIDSQNWLGNYVFGGDGKWTEGINIVREQMGTPPIEPVKVIEETQYYKLTSEILDYRVYDYYCYFYDVDGNLAKRDGPLPKLPKISSVEEGLVKLTVQAGTGLSTQWGYYYDAKNNRFSETFEWIFDEFEGLVAYGDYDGENVYVTVRDIFDKTVFYKEIKEYENEFSVAIEPIVNVEFVGDNTISVTYLTGEDYQEVTEIFTLE